MPDSAAGLRFDLEWRITLFTLLLVPLMIFLGFWQLQRADEKALLATSFEQKQQQDPASIDELWAASADTLAYLPVEMRGTFANDRYFLLDNRMLDGKFGYEVVGIMQLHKGGAVLVNRGWIAADPARQSLPEVPAVAGEVAITAHVYVAPGEPYLLQEQHLGGAWPKRIQAIEMEKLNSLVAPLVDGGLFPYPVRIDAGSSGALSLNWQVVNVSPQKHQAYAVQWFTMAAVLALIYLLRSTNLWQLLAKPGRARD